MQITNVNTYARKYHPFTKRERRVQCGSGGGSCSNWMCGAAILWLQCGSCVLQLCAIWLLIGCHNMAVLCNRAIAILWRNVAAVWLPY